MIYNNLAFNLFSFSGLVLGIICTLMAIILLIYGRNNLHRILAFFNIAVGVWGYGAFNIGRQQDQYDALIAWRLAFIGVIFISVFFYHGMCSFVQINRSKIIIFSYIQGILFLILNATDLFISKVFYFKDSFYYMKSVGFLFPLSFIFWFMLVVAGFLELLMRFNKFEGIKRRQASYMLFSFGIGFMGGTTNFFPMFGIDIIPFGNITIPIYCLLITYAMLRYKILDLKLAVTRAGIFLSVYVLVLGIPFWLGWRMFGMGNWLIPTVISTVLASIGPFIFIYFQRRAEAQILKEEKRIYSLIKKASAGMVGIRDIQKLFNVLIDVLRNNLRLDHAFVYLFDPNEDSYILKASKPEDKERMTLTSGSPLFDRLRKTKYPVYYEEMLHLQDNSKGENGHIKEIVTQMQQLSATVVIPAIKEDVLLAFIVLGKREGKDVFSPELLDLLYVVGNEIALAIEISLSLIERDKLLNDNFEKSYYAGLGYLCTSVSHQMNNRFGGVINLLYDPWETLEETNYKELPHEELVKLVDTIKDRIKSTLDIAENGGQVTKDILDLSKSKMEPGIVEFDNALNKSISFVLIKRINSKLEVVREYPKDVLLWIGQAPLQDILANALDNTWFAMNLKKNHFNDPNYKPMVIVRGHVHKAMFHFEIEDNGMGIKKEYLNRVLDPMFTTKSHQDGTGMGTWVMKQFIEKHGGTITYESEWEHWTKAKISLPLATKEQKEEKKNV